MTLLKEIETTASDNSAYIKPQDVTSPREMWQLIDMVYDGGMDKIAVALGLWDKSPVLALRWNGTAARPKGHPMLSVHPTWFVLPQMFNLPILAGVAVELCRHQPRPINQVIGQLELPIQKLYDSRFNRALSLIRHPVLERTLTIVANLPTPKMLS